MEKWSLNVFTHICTCSSDVLYPFLSFHTHNSSLEGAMELKFAPFCSSQDALSVGITFCQSQNFQILAENHGLVHSLIFWESSEKSIPLYRKRKEKSNGACLSCVAPSSGELCAFKVFYSLYI